MTREPMTETLGHLSISASKNRKSKTAMYLYFCPASFSSYIGICLSVLEVRKTLSTLHLFPLVYISNNFLLYYQRIKIKLLPMLWGISYGNPGPTTMYGKQQESGIIGKWVASQRNSIISTKRDWENG